MVGRTRVEALPEECLSHVISFTSPSDACRSSLASATFRDAADSDLLWEKFLPSDYREIIARSVSPVKFSSMKELFRQLSSTPLLIDGGKKTFLIDKYANKKCYMLSARELSITWSTNSLCWCWKPLQQSRFPEAVELVMVCWLEIIGKINSKMLSPNTTYGAYLVVQLAGRAFGLGTRPSEVSVEVVGNYRTRGTICVKRHECKTSLGLDASRQEEEKVVCERGDGWLEMELGEFYNDESEKEVKMVFREIKGEHLKGGLVVEGIELRPKQ
ncbi:hypothetical protein RD792_015873 [Penstemon davidsonii]|uniref:F-box domain-containing protein n=1 Tax=Penstemon davidsonii TaxID=160366 RepID=A0ABR0CJI7_9LAMI|nr:hypothetical protein RD792_015873 [Penstemon davidsonii]